MLAMPGGWLAVAAGLASLAACALPGSDEPPPFYADFVLRGTWQWAHLVEEPGLRRLERETWSWHPTRGAHAPGVLRGSYLREVTVRSSLLPFACNQDQQYTQRAWYEVEAHPVPPSARRRRGEPAPGEAPPEPPGDLELVELSYRTEPSPCDHGFRKLGRYRAFSSEGRLLLRFPEGQQTLWRTSDERGPARPPWEQRPARLGGSWQWRSVSTDEQGLVRREEEHWELAVAAAFVPCLGCGFGAFAPLAEHAKLFDGIYTRRVTVESADGAAIPCAGAAAYGFEDRFILEGRRHGPVIALRETAVAAAPHPCLRARDERSLDSATLEQQGEHLVLDWRGKRRQVLHRPR
jgi:hypothetical protein